MNKFACCTILMVFGTNILADCELTADRTSVSKSTLYGILNNQEEFNDDYKVLLWEFARSHFEGCTINVALSSNSCLICDRVLGVLMNASVQSFLTVNDIAATNYSVFEKPTDVVPTHSYYGFVVFLTQNINEFFEHFAKLQLMYAWNPRAQHLIFTVEEPDDKELEMIFKECWSSRILNIAVIIWNQAEAYTYNPYLKNHSEMREVVHNWSRLYYDKLRNMNGYVIQTKYIPFSGTDTAKWINEEARFKFYGSDFGYADAFFQSVNATPAFINLTVNSVPLYQNFTYRYKMWTDLEFYDAELWINFMILQIEFRVRSERAYPLRTNHLRILVSKSGLKTPSIFDPYNNIAWTCVMLSLITFALYTRVLYIRRRIDDNAFFRIFGIFLGQNLAKRRYGLLEKLTFLVFTMTSLLILSAYQGALYSALATVSYYPEIDTISQLCKLTNTMNAHQVFLEYLRLNVQPGINVVARSTVDVVDYMITHRDEAYAFPNNIAEFTSKLKVLSENGIPFYHLMNNYSFPAFASYTLPYGSPYLQKLERVCLACREAGLDQYWEAEINLYSILSGTIIYSVAEKRPLKKLSLLTQLTAFYIWGIGLIVSSFCFVAEIYLHKSAKKMLIKSAS